MNLFVDQIAMDSHCNHHFIGHDNNLALIDHTVQLVQAAPISKTCR